jgi:GNAT superfamily N-acetyltransferase
MTAILRSADLDDSVAFHRLRQGITPYQVFTPAGIRHWWVTSTAAAHLLVLLAEVDGEVVGAGRASINTWTSEVGAGSLFVMVDPAFRGQGIGGQLYSALMEHLVSQGAQRLQAWAVDEPGALAFCGSRDFERTHELRFSRLDVLGPLPPMPPLPSGVTVASAREVGPEGVYSVDVVAIMDEPNDVPADSVSYDEWFTDIWQGPELDLDASTVVLVDGVPASYTLIESDHTTHRMWSAGTGTLREHRGRGFAKIAKSVAVRRAAEAGITAAYTSNDEVNKPMLAVNEWLGYQPCARQWSHVKML